jgi:hypothetical protein
MSGTGVCPRRSASPITGGTRWFRARRNEVYIFCTLLCCSAYFLPRWASWNENSRIDLVLAIVDDHTFRIDRYADNTGDFALVDGHRYSDKAPGLSFLAVPVYALARPLLRSALMRQILDSIGRTAALAETLRPGGRGLSPERTEFMIVLYLAILAGAAIPTAALGVVLYRFMVIVAPRAGTRAGAALLYGLATPAFPFSGAFFSHQLTALLLFASFVLAYRSGQRGARPWHGIVIGLLLGYALVTEYPSLLIAGAVFAYGVVRTRSARWSLEVLAGALLPLSLLGAYNCTIFGTPLPVGYLHSALYQDLHMQGFISLIGPTLPAAWGITFGTFRGLFFVAPILLLAFPGFVAWWRSGQHRSEASVCLWAVVSFMVFNASSVMWHGGYSVGPRYLLPMLPFMTVGLAAFLNVWRTYFWATASTVALGAWSVFAVWSETLAGQSFPDWTPNPLLNYSLPQLWAGNVARNLGMAIGLRGVSSIAPLGLVIGAALLRWRLAARPAGEVLQPSADEAARKERRHG